MTTNEEPERPHSRVLEGWADRWRALRNRFTGDAGFQRWAAAFPLTRPMARRRAQALFDLSAGFVYSQIAFACVRSGLLELLQPGPRNLADLARALDLGEAGADRLLKAAVALKLAEPCGRNRYGLGSEGAALLGAPGVAAMIEHHAHLYADLADPLALLRREGGGGGMLAGYWPYAASDHAPAGAPVAQSTASTEPETATARYSRLMSLSQDMVAAQVTGAWPLAAHRRLMDVGGGDGAFLRAAARSAPRLELALFDLPGVATIAADRFAAESLPVAVSGGSFLEDDLPTGADLVTLVRILHDHDDEPVRRLLRAVRKAIAPGGTILIAEPMAGPGPAERVGDAYFGMYLLAMGSGRPRTPAEIMVMLQEAGFARPRRVPTAMPMIAQVVIAQA